MNYFIFGPSGVGKGEETFRTFMMPAFMSQRPNPEYPEIAQGRDVFGNIGIDREKIEAYLGHAIRYTWVSNAEIRDPENWPILGDPGTDGERDVLPGKLFTFGCVLILDECRSIWRNNESIAHRILQSIDTQRHFSTDEGHGIDVIWQGQTKKQFHRDVRDNGEAYYKLAPVEELNIKDAHKVTLFASWSCTKQDIMGEPAQLFYHNKDFYGMWQSVATGQAARHIIDQRIRHNPRSMKFWYWLMGGVTAVGIITVVVVFWALSGSGADDDSSGSTTVAQPSLGTKNQGASSNEISSNCTEPRIFDGDVAYVVRPGDDGIARAIPFDGTCSAGSGNFAGAGFRPSVKMGGFAGAL